MGESRIRPEHEPEAKGERADSQNERHEDATDPIGQALDGRLGSLRPPNEIDDMSQRGIATHASCPEEERAPAIHRRADDLGPGTLLDRHRFAGQHRLVDRRLALHDPAVDGDALARPNSNHIANADILERDIDLGAGADDSSRPSLEPEQFLDGTDRLSLGTRLEPAARENQADDGGRAVEVGLGLDTGRAEDARRECNQNAETPGHRGTDDDERVHARGTVDRRPPGRAIEAPTGPELDDRRRSDEHPGQLLHR